MKHERAMERRQFLKGTVGAATIMALSGCDNLTQSTWFPSILNKAEKLTERVQRAVTPANALAKEYVEADISKVFPANGNTDPGTVAYAKHVSQNFAEWSLDIVGLVQTPMSCPWRRSKNFRLAPKLPGTTAWKVGAQSASGRASRSAI
ncbi:MAG: hypothetical protein ACT4OL_11360 [Nitrospiraceae bacterium]